MPWVPINFTGQYAEARAELAAKLLAQNVYVEQNPRGGKTPTTIHGTPGLDPWTTVGTGIIRGMHVMEPHLYVVVDNDLWAVDSVKAATQVNGSITGSGKVHMTDNGTHIAVATSTHLYAANLTDGIDQLPESGMNGATYQDGYGIFTQRGTEFFWLTGIDDMTTINALDFSSADVFADKLVGCISDHRELILLGERTTEVWQNTGAAAFPFARAQSVERGCLSSHSIAKALNAVFFLGDDLQVYAMSGYNPQPISNPAIVKAISESADPTTGYGFTYSQEGHTFYVLTFTDLTLVFDISTGAWHTRKSWDETRWRINSYAEFRRQHLVGDFETNNIYELNLDTYDENGAILQRVLTSQPLHQNGKAVACHELYVDLEAGVGLTTGQGSDPEIMLSWSDDGGKNWTVDKHGTIGAIGEYKWRAHFYRLGEFYQRIFRIRLSDPVKFAMLAAYAEMEGRAR